MKPAAVLKQVNIKMPLSTYEQLKSFSVATGRTVQSILIASSDEYLQRQEQLAVIERESMLSWQDYLNNDVEDVAELLPVINSIRERAKSALASMNKTA